MSGKRGDDMDLAHLLADCARESGMRVGADSAAMRRLAAALRDNSGLNEMARASLAAAPIHPDVMRRDHVSRWRQDVLARALARCGR